MINAHIHLSVGESGQAIAGGSVLVDVVDKAMSRIRTREEGEHIEEVAIGQVVVFQHILSPASGAQQRDESKERKDGHGELTLKRVNVRGPQW